MSELPEKGLITYYQANDELSDLTPDSWYVNTSKRHAFQVAADYDALQSSKIIPEQASPDTQTITTFSDIASKLYRTKVSDNGDETQKIELELADRIITLMMDQSGSMTWNDANGLRHSIARRMVQRSAATYPGDVSYNVVRFGGLPVNVTLFGVVENNSLQQNDLQSLSAAFFEDDENNFAGVRVVRNEERYPTNALDGETIQEGFFVKAADEGLNEDQEYFYTVYTYDKDARYSKGVQIKAAPRRRQIPRGVSSAKASTLIGSGIVRDEFTKGLWHFGEKNNRLLLDFSNSKDNMLIDSLEPVWLNTSEVPVGTSGLRFDGELSATSIAASPNTAIATGDSVTLMAWVFPYNLNANRTIISRGTNATLNYSVSISSSGAIVLHDGSTSVQSSAGAVSALAWNNIAVVVNASSTLFYVNGELISTVAALTAYDADNTFKFCIGKDISGTTGDAPFFGKITEVSFHSDYRSASYISDAYEVPVLDDNPNSTVQSSSNGTDNGDRLVVISYEVPADYNFTNIRFVRNDLRRPSWEGDGDLIATKTASPGIYILTDTDDFAIDNTYYYRIWTENSLGNLSYQSDSPTLNVAIPSFKGVDTLEALNTPLFGPSDAQAQAGNRKVYLTWKNFVLDTRIAFVEIYHSSSGYPVITDSEGNDGTLIFRGKVTDEEFVHRKIDNAKASFYTIVNRDRYGRISQTATVNAIPSANAVETGIPLLEVENIRYEIADNETLSIQWDSPIEFKANLEGYLDQRVVLYGAVTDEFGQPISDETNITMKITPTISRQKQDADVFGTGGLASGTLDDSDFYRFGVTRPAKGIIKGALAMTNSAQMMSLLESASFDIQIYSYVNDPETGEKVFEFYSIPVTIKLKNPFEMELVNRDGRDVCVRCPVDLSGIDFGSQLNDTDFSYEEKCVDGAYCRSTQPFVARVKLKYRGLPLELDTKVRVQSWDANDDICNKKFAPRAIRPSGTVVPPASVVSVIRGTEEETNADGEGEGGIVEISYADIPLSIPRKPQGAMVFAQAEYGGYIITRSMYFLIGNILFTELTARPPLADGIDVAEQTATVYILDPDFPDDKKKRRTVPNNTIASWWLSIREFGKQRPFYSSDALPSLGGDVRSYVRNGVTKTFFGPASGVILHEVETEDGGIKIIGERYEIGVSVIWDGLASDDYKLVEILPLGLDDRNKFGLRFLMELPQFKNIIWANGEDFVKLVISKNSSAPSVYSRYGNCFQRCALADGAELIDLTAGQIINLFAGADVEILWGDVTESVDPYTGEPILVLGEEAQTAIGSAQIEIQDAPETYVWFRINAFFPPPAEPCGSSKSGGGGGGNSTDELLNPCVCLGIKSDEPALPDQCTELQVRGSTLILLDQQPEAVVGGGSMDEGVPPTIIVPKEPLQIKIVENLAGGVPSDTFVMDGSTINQIVVAVSFADKPVPNGTPVTIDIQSELDGGLPRLQLASRTIYTNTYLDTRFDSVNEKSYAILSILPLSSEDGINETLIFSTTYDKSGEVERKQQACVIIEYNPADEATGGGSSGGGKSNKKLYAFNTVTETWDENFVGPNHDRGGLALHADGEYLYAIGGIDKKTISNIVEKCDIDANTWTDMATMPTARFCPQSVLIDGKIYVLGGISTKAGTNTLEVSSAFEVYDIDDNSWEVLDDMPTIDDDTVNGQVYGVAMGLAFHMNVSGEDRIYVISGVTEINNEGEITRFNDRVLYYSLSDQNWHSSAAFSDFELEVYRRIAPTGYIDGNKLVVVGGAIVDTRADSTGALTFLTDTFSLDVVTGVFEQNDYEFSKIPRPRYKAACVSIGETRYFLGGSDNKSQTLNVVEKIDTTSSPYTFTKLAAMPSPTTMFGATVASTVYLGVDYIFVAGGFSSGRKEGFLQIRSSYTPDKVRLDGKQTCSVSVELVDANGDAPEHDVKIIARGFVTFGEGSELSGEERKNLQEAQSDDAQRASASKVDSRLAVYPVVFTSREVTTEDGKAIITLLPRSDDVLDGIEEIAKRARIDQEALGEDDSQNAGDAATHVIIKSGEVREPYKILVQLTVIDDYYFGQTIADTRSDPEEDPLTPTPTGGETPTTPTGGDNETPTGGGSEENPACKNASRLTSTLEWEGYTSGVDLGNIGPINNAAGSYSNASSSSSFSLIPSTMGQLNSPLVPYYIDIDWIPTIDVLLGENNHTSDETLAVLKNLENEVSFGGSALFDALIASSRFLSESDVDGIGKVIYVFTDNEANMSINGLQTAIDEVNAIDGFQETPIVVGNFSVVSPVTLSAKANTTDTNNLNALTQQTNGQSLTILSADFENETVGIFSGEALGSLGYGEAYLNIDLGEVVSITSISALFELYENTNGKWKIEYSQNGYSYTELKEYYKANVQVQFKELEARYLKLTATLVTGFSASNEPEYELIPLPASPALTSIEIAYDTQKASYIYLNTVEPEAPVQQVVVTVDASRVRAKDIQLGVAKSESHNWEDYQKSIQPKVDQHGKIFVPIRYGDDEELIEPLTKIDRYTYRAHNGQWNPESTVTIIDEESEIVDSSIYALYPREGLVVFNQRKTGSFKIKIKNVNKFRVGVKLFNRSSENPLEVYGVGFMYNSNVNLLPPVEKVAPEATNVQCLPDEVGRYTKIEATFEFKDANGDEEDVAQRELLWYVNGVRIPYLDGLTEWNDIENTDDPLYTNCFTFDPDDLPVETSIIAEARKRNESIIKAGDRVWFTIKMNDGNLFTERVKSNVLVVGEAEPTISSISLKGITPDLKITNRITSETTLFVQFSLIADSDVNNSTIAWYLGGELFKEGKMGTDANADRILPGEISETNADIGLVINNSIYCTVTPETGEASGEASTSDTIIVQNAIPTVANVKLAPARPKPAQNVVLSFTFSDNDINVLNDGTQRNRSTVAWYKSNRASNNEFIEVREYANVSILPSVATSVGDKWKAIVTPFDGLDSGVPAESNIVTIG